MKEVEYVLLIFLDSASQNENNIILHIAHYPEYLGKMDEKYSTNSIHILSQQITRVSFMIFNFCLFHKALQRTD